MDYDHEENKNPFCTATLSIAHILGAFSLDLRKVAGIFPGLRGSDYSGHAIIRYPRPLYGLFFHMYLIRSYSRYIAATSFNQADLTMNIYLLTCSVCLLLLRYFRMRSSVDESISLHFMSALRVPLSIFNNLGNIYLYISLRVTIECQDAY